MLYKSIKIYVQIGNFAEIYAEKPGTVKKLLKFY